MTVALLILIAVAFIPCSVRLSAQGLSTNRVESTTNAPLVIAQRAPAGMPIRVLAGAGGSIRALEIDGMGGTWMRGPLSIGENTGATPSELVRVASIPTANGKGLVISLSGASTSSGLLISDIGLTGTENAGLVLSSVANGTGTGIRLGGGQGSMRPTLSTGIDITGGVGIRYNALTSGSGTAIEIGGTQPPRRGMEIVAAGSEHVGIIAHANTAGTGIIGSSRSLAYPTVGPYPRVGIVGHSASNSTAATDTCTGLLGVGIRGGSAGSSTITMGVNGTADLRAGSSTGIAIGVLGRAVASEQSGTLTIGGLFRTTDRGLAIVADGDVYLGSADDVRPPGLNRTALALLSTRTTTHAYDLNVSGELSHRTARLLPAPDEDVIEVAGTVVQCTEYAARRIQGGFGARVTGLSPVNSGRIVLLCNVGQNEITLVHEELAVANGQRFWLPDALNADIRPGACSWFWYDSSIQRWRRIQ
jgi:hypothetical protein